jgi:type 1 glutamine amidotransferase
MPLDIYDTPHNSEYNHIINIYSNIFLQSVCISLYSILILDDEEIVKNAGSFANYYPAVWYQNFEGGHIWSTTLGHTKENYSEPTYVNHLLQGIQYIANQYDGLHYDQAHAITKDDALK